MPESLTAQQFTTSGGTAFKPVDIITSSYPGDSVSGEKGGYTVRAEVVHNPGPPILAALYAEAGTYTGVYAEASPTSTNLIIDGADNCAIATPFCSLCELLPRELLTFTFIRRTQAKRQTYGVAVTLSLLFL